MKGRKIGNYELRDKIGEGGMGAVYRGVDLMLEREVAVKVLRPELSEQPNLVERFRSEAVTLARLNHPNIATLYSFFQEGQDLFMVMEFVHGYTLESVLKRQGALPAGQALPLFGQALDGIGHAHALGVVHRDLKAANIMITEAGLVKVMDFGIARVLGTARLTRTGHLIGTLEYMSPEQIRGEDIDARADVYAMGVLLYEMLTGHVPFESDSDFGLMRAHIEAAPPSPRALDPGLPAAVEGAIMRALAKNPDDRFQTVEDFHDALLPETREGVALPKAPRAPRATRLAVSAVAKQTRQAVEAGTEGRVAALRKKLTWKHLAVAVAVPIAVIALLLVLRGPSGPDGSRGTLATDTTAADTSARAFATTGPSGRPASGIPSVLDPQLPAQPDVLPAPPQNPPEEPAPQTSTSTEQTRPQTPPSTRSERPRTERPPDPPPPPRTGQVRVIVRPYGDVYIDGRRRVSGTNQVYAEELPAGTYRVRAEHPSFGTWDKQVTVRPGETREVLFNFNVEYEITVTSDPTNAQVVLDGEALRRHTPTRLKLRPGRHAIEVQKPGYEMSGSRQQITVEGNVSRPVHFELRRKN